MLKYYIATTLSNAAEHNEVRDLLSTGNNYKLTYDWTSHGGVLGNGRKECEKVCKTEIEGVLQSDVVIVLLPGGKGTHTELGVALATHKRVILVVDDRNKLDCVFYYHDKISIVERSKHHTWADLLYELHARTGVYYE